MPSSPLFALIVVVAGLVIAMTCAWVAEQRTGNAGWIDVSWTFGLAIVGVLAALLPGGLPARQGLVIAFVAVWALRLGLHIARRTCGITDDPRYAKLREGYGADATRQMLLLAQKQAVVSIPLAYAIYLAAHNPAPALRLQDWLGVLIMLIAIGGEALADAQLRGFARDPANKGKICDIGLWATSRHPNYFFEWFGWLAYCVIAIDLTGAYSWGFLSLAAPACMYWLLVYISGIPPLEEHMLESRGDAFRAYQRRTNAFFPGPSRSSTTS
jgi:steroid 5-alpha reductase family enzyme